MAKLDNLGKLLVAMHSCSKSCLSWKRSVENPKTGEPLNNPG